MKPKHIQGTYLVVAAECFIIMSYFLSCDQCIVANVLSTIRTSILLNSF